MREGCVRLERPPELVADNFCNRSLLGGIQRFRSRKDSNRGRLQAERAQLITTRAQSFRWLRRMQAEAIYARCQLKLRENQLDGRFARLHRLNAPAVLVEDYLTVRHAHKLEPELARQGSVIGIEIRHHCVVVC